jgi:hypothetical protein
MLCGGRAGEDIPNLGEKAPSLHEANSNRWAFAR